MDPSRRLQTIRAALSRRWTSLDLVGRDAEDPRSARVAGRGDPHAAALGPGEHRLVQLAQMVADLLHAEREEQLQRGVEPREVLVRQRHQLEAAGVRPQGLVVLGEAGEIVGALEGEPPGDRGVEALDQLAADVDEARAPGRQQPLLPPAGQHVHLGAGEIHRQLSDPLDRVHHQERAGLPGRRGEPVQIHQVAVAELHQRHRENPHPRIAQPLQQPRLVGPPFRRRRHQLHGDAAILEPEPGVDVGGELLVAHQHDRRPARAAVPAPPSRCRTRC